MKEGQTQEPCNGNCGMNYCDEYGCIENKPLGNVSHFLTPPQEPVGGMKTAKEIVQKHKSIESRQSSNRMFGGYLFEYLNLHSAELAIEEYHNQFTPPPAPIKTEGEAVIHPSGLQEILGNDTAWPLVDVLKRLASASEYLLDIKDYDGPDWEEISHSVKAAKEYIQKLTSNQPPQPLGINERRRDEDISDKERLYWAAIASSVRDGNIGFLMEHYVVTKVSEASLPQSSTEEDRETKRQPIEDALYATKRFLTTEATDLAEGILDYLNDHGFTITDALPVTGESEAIGMIKWIRENYEPEFGDGRHWEDILDEAETPISDKELYNLYKQSKK